MKTFGSMHEIVTHITVRIYHLSSEWVASCKLWFLDNLHVLANNGQNGFHELCCEDNFVGQLQSFICCRWSMLAGQSVQITHVSGKIVSETGDRSKPSTNLWITSGSTRERSLSHVRFPGVARFSRDRRIWKFTREPIQVSKKWFFI